jgi:hypothetical protein
MAIARSTISLFGFLATTALGAGLTFVNKKVGIGVAVAGAVCSVANLIYNLCIRNITPTQPIEKGWQAVDTKGKVSLLDSDDEHEQHKEGASDPLSDVPLLPDSTSAAVVNHNPGVIAKMGAALLNMFGRKEHAKQI